MYYPNNITSGIYLAYSSGYRIAYQIIKNKTYLFSIILVITFLLLMVLFLPNYIQITPFVLVSVATLFVIKPTKNNPSRYNSYFWLSLIFTSLTLFSGVRTFYFFGICYALLLVVEINLFRIGYLPLFIPTLISPTFKYFDNMLGFPIRLQLTEWTGVILNFAGYKNTISGNTISLNGTEFSVDPACMGLYMLAYSILISLIIMGYFQKRNSKEFPMYTILIILCIVIFLNLVANLLRIVILTMFKILPDNPLHEILGIICFILYIIIPVWFIVKWFSEITINPNHPLKSKQKAGKLLGLKLFLLCSFIVCCGFYCFNNKKSIESNLTKIEIPGYKKQVVENGILKFEKDGFLVYVKPLERFYGAEHNPMICWTGSGYIFNEINTKTIQNTDVYMGTLIKGNDIIYASWWFDNGKLKTIKQVDWRIEALKGEKFSLVNVNASSYSQLLKETRKLINSDFLKIKN